MLFLKKIKCRSVYYLSVFPATNNVSGAPFPEARQLKIEFVQLSALDSAPEDDVTQQESWFLIGWLLTCAGVLQLWSFPPGPKVNGSCLLKRIPALPAWTWSGSQQES